MGVGVDMANDPIQSMVGGGCESLLGEVRDSEMMLMLH